MIGVQITGEMIKEACNYSKKRIFLLKNVVYFVNLDGHCVYCSISVRSRTVQNVLYTPPTTHHTTF